MKRLLHATITKVDEATRTVEGVLVEEAVDKDVEIFDYASSKPFFEKWNKFFADKTSELGLEKSVGNLRVMHTKEVAGKFTEMIYDDSAKKIYVAAKVSNDSVWNSVLAGEYTGFSIGARYVKKWKDNASGAMRWTADPFEGSIVDNPAMYGATFTKVGADGVATAVKVTGRASKCLSCVAQFACILQDLNYLAKSLEYETEYEQDGSPIAREVRDVVANLGDLLVRYTREEVDEANNKEKTMATSTGKDEPGVRPAAALAAASEPGARATIVQPSTEKAAIVSFDPETASVEELERHQTEIAAKIAAKKIAVVPAAGETPETNVEKAMQAGFATLTNKVAKLLDDRFAAQDATLETRFKAVNDALETMADRTIPTPVNVKGVAVPKEGDGVTQKTDEKPANVLDAVKLAHTRPGQRAGA